MRILACTALLDRQSECECCHGIQLAVERVDESHRKAIEKRLSPDTASALPVQRSTRKVVPSCDREVAHGDIIRDLSEWQWHQKADATTSRGR